MRHDYQPGAWCAGLLREIGKITARRVDDRRVIADSLPNRASGGAVPPAR
jgi:hypothetical protein